MSRKFLSPVNLLHLTDDPVNGSDGDIYFNTTSNVIKVYYSSAWHELSTSGSGGGTGITVSITTPTSPSTGDAWYKNDTGEFYIYDGTFWVEVNGTISQSTSTVLHQVKLGASIAKGQAVYVSSANGTNMIVSKASNDAESTSSKTMGLLQTGGVLNDQVNVITEGLLDGLDTSTAGAEGDPVWLGTNGNLIFGLANKPVAPAHLVYIGVVTRKQQNNGEIFVKVQNGYELEELHNVGIGYGSSIEEDSVLRYDSTSSLWKNTSPNVITAKNTTETTIDAFTPVYINSQIFGDTVVTFVKADASQEGTLPANAITVESVPNVTLTKLITSGIVTGVTLTGYSDNDLLYVANGGGFTKTRPTGSNAINPIARVLSVDNGTIYFFGSTFTSSTNTLPNLTNNKIWLGSTGRPTETTLDTSVVPENSNLYFTDERAQDATASMLTNGVHNGISVEYNDSSNIFNFTNTGVTSIFGTANEIEVSSATGGVTIGLPNDVIIPSWLTIGGSYKGKITLKDSSGNEGGTIGATADPGINIWGSTGVNITTTGDFTTQVGGNIILFAGTDGSGKSYLTSATSGNEIATEGWVDTNYLTQSNAALTYQPVDGTLIDISYFSHFTHEDPNNPGYYYGIVGYAYNNGSTGLEVLDINPNSLVTLNGTQTLSNKSISNILNFEYNTNPGTAYGSIQLIDNDFKIHHDGLTGALVLDAYNNIILSTTNGGQYLGSASSENQIATIGSAQTLSNKVFMTGIDIQNPNDASPQGYLKINPYLSDALVLFNDADIHVTSQWDMFLNSTNNIVMNSINGKCYIGSVFPFNEIPTQQWVIDQNYASSIDIANAVINYVPLSQKGNPQGVAELDIDGYVPVSQLPDLSGTYLTSYTETDTLDSVASRGSWTSSNIDIGSNMASSSPWTGALTVTGGVGIGEDLYVNNNVYIGGNIDITGTITGSLTLVDVTNLAVTDPLIYLAEGNPSDSVDIGIFAALNHGGPSYNHTGLIRDASDSGKWKLVSGLDDPTANAIDFTGATYDTLKIGALEVTDSSTTRTNLGLAIGTDIQAYSSNLNIAANPSQYGYDTGKTLIAAFDGTISWEMRYSLPGNPLTVGPGKLLVTGNDVPPSWLSPGTAGQVLKVNTTEDGLEWGTLDLSSYLTSSTAASTYAPINSPTFTGTVSGITKSMVGLGSVENTAISTWAGSTNITTVGTISSGTWEGTKVDAAHGGTGKTSYSTGDLLYGNGSGGLSTLTATTNGYVLTLASGVPTWAAASGGGGGLSTTTTSITTTSATTIATFAGLFQSGEVIVHIYQDDGNNVNTYSSKIFINNSTGAGLMTEYAILESSVGAVPVSFSFNSGNLQVAISNATQINMSTDVRTVVIEVNA